MPLDWHKPWLTAEDAFNLFASCTPSKLGQELARGVDPNQLLEIPNLDSAITPRSAMKSVFPEVPEAERHEFRCRVRDALRLPPPRPDRQPSTAAAADVEAEVPGSVDVDATWGWDPSWDDSVPRPKGEPPPPTDGRWSLLLVACLIGHSPLQLDRLLKAGADPNVVHPRSGSTALTCLIQNEQMGVAGKKEAIQLLAKYGFKRWAGVRRDAVLEAVTMVLLNMAAGQQAARKAIAQLRPSASGGPKPVKAGEETAAAILERWHKKAQEGLELLEELFRRRAWPPARGCPFYVFQPLMEQMAMALMLLDAAAVRVLELLVGPYAGSMGFGQNTMTLRMLLALMLKYAGCSVANSQGKVWMMSQPVLMKRLLAAGIRLDEPITTLDDMLRNPLEPELLLSPGLLGDALEAGLPVGLLTLFTISHSTPPPWRSLLAEAITEGHPRDMVETLLRRGADPRAPVLGCIRPLTLATMSCNPESYTMLVQAGAPESDAPSSPAPTDSGRIDNGSRLRALVRQPLRTAKEPVLWPHLSWLACEPPDTLMNLLPLLSSPRPDNRLTLLALMRCSNSRALRITLGRGGEGPEGSRPGDLNNRLMAVHLDSAFGLIGTFILEDPANPYIPYFLTIFMHALRSVLLHPKLLRLIAAPVMALADRLDPPSDRLLAATAATAATASAPSPAPVPPIASCPNEGGTSGPGTSGPTDMGRSSPPREPSGEERGPGPGSSCGSASAGMSCSSKPDSGTTSRSDSAVAPARSDTAAGSSRTGGTTAKATTSPFTVDAASAATATSGTPPWSSSREGSLLQQLPPAWPSEQELPYEVLREIVLLPHHIGMAFGRLIPEVVRHVWNSGYLSALVRLASVILRTEALAVGSAVRTGGPEVQSSAAAGSSPYDSGGAPTMSMCRWRLLATIFASSIKGLGQGDDEPVLPPRVWVPSMVLMLYRDPWVSALVADDSLDALAQATHQAAAEAAAQSAPADAAGGRSGCGGGTTDTARTAAAGAPPPWEERLACVVEATMHRAVWGMSQGFSCPLNCLVRDAWTSPRVAATIAARRDSASLAAAGPRNAKGTSQSPPASGGAAAGAAGKASKKSAARKAKGGSTVTEAQRPGTAKLAAQPEALSYEPYGRLLVVVPYWVQMAVTHCVWDILSHLWDMLREEGAVVVAREMLHARSKLGPPLGR